VFSDADFAVRAVVAGSVSIRIVIFILLGWFGLVGRCAANTTHSLKTSRVTGREYVSLAAWAGSKDFKITWAHKETEVTVSNPWAQLFFRVGERKVVINHRSVWMSFPMTMLNDGPYIARLDLNTMLEPLLFPQILAKPVTIKTVMLDPGHGGRDPGNIHGNQPEKHYNLLLAKEIKRRLETIGIKTLLTRTDDTFVELDERPAMASRAKADIFISLHYNAAPGNNDVSKGLEVYCLTPAGAYSSHSHRDEIDNRVYPGNKFDTLNAQLAFQIHKGILKNLGGEDRGIRRARLAVLKSAQMPAVLLEGGFLSNPEDARRIYSEKYRRQLAQAIVSGVLAYKRLVERRPAPTPTVEPEPKPAIVKTKPTTTEESSSNISTNHAEPASPTKGGSAKAKAPAKPPGTVASKTTNLVARPAATNATPAESAAAKANGGKGKSPAKPPMAISTNLITRPAATNAPPGTELAPSGTKAANSAKAKSSTRPAGASPAISTNLVTRTASTNAPAGEETNSPEANPPSTKPRTPPRTIGTNSAPATNLAPKAANSNSATATGSTPPAPKSASAKAKPAAKSPGATAAISTNLVTRTAATNAPAGTESTAQEAKLSPTKAKTALRTMGTNATPATNSAPKTVSTNSAASTGVAPPAAKSASAKAKPAAKSPGATDTISTNLITRPVSTNSVSTLEAGPAARPASAPSASQPKAAPAVVDP
jgi:N-acetylmuramoyl-L-alanine amidase